jgi:hypothetical protein
MIGIIYAPFACVRALERQGLWSSSSIVSDVSSSSLDRSALSNLAKRKAVALSQKMPP